MASLVDLFYPDNKNRVSRINDLAADCNSFQREITSQKDEFDSLLITVNDKIKTAFNKFHKEPKFETVKLPDGTIIGDIFVGALSIFESTRAVYGMNLAWKTWMLRQGRIGEAALVKIIGYPKFFKVARVGVAIVVMVGLDAIITAISGAIQRDQLKQGIHDSIQPRRNLLKAREMNKVLLDNLRSTIDVLDALADLPSEIYEATLTKLAAKAETKMAAITDAYIENMLVQRDKSTGSWTNEDNEKNTLLQLQELAEAPVEYLDGSLVKATDTLAVYLIIGGKRCHVPNPTVYNTLFANWNSIHLIERRFLESMPLGESLSEDACLIEGNDGITYLYSNGQKRLIRSIGEFNQAGFARDKIKKMPQDQINAIASADDFIVAEW